MTAKKDKHSDAVPPTRFDNGVTDSESSGLSTAPEAATVPNSELQAQVNQLSQELSEAQEKATAYWDRLLRKEADMQNMERRAQQDVENARKFAIERFASELLQVLDSLEQGLTYVHNGNADVAQLAEGMTLTQSVLMNILDKQGIQEINPEGQAFNPNFHEAISMQENADLPPNQIVMVVQKGYMLNNRLLRPARVIVSKKPQG